MFKARLASVVLEKASQRPAPSVLMLHPDRVLAGHLRSPFFPDCREYVFDYDGECLEKFSLAVRTNSYLAQHRRNRIGPARVFSIGHAGNTTGYRFLRVATIWSGTEDQ